MNRLEKGSAGEDEGPEVRVNWLEVQASHHEKAARLAVAYAAAYEGDLSFEGSEQEIKYLRRRVSAYRREADRRFVKASELRSRGKPQAGKDLV